MINQFLPRLSIIILSFGCNQDRTSIEINAAANIIDVASINEPKELISPRELLTEVEYIVLNQRDSFFLTSARKILELDKKLLILDANKEELVAYDLKGRYLGKVGKKGMGPQEFRGANDFTVDPVRGKILIFSRTDKAVIEFNSDLSFSRKVRLNTWAFQMSLLSSGHIALYTNYSGEEPNNILIYDIEGNQIDSRMPYAVNGDYTPMDYTGFIVGNYYTYPLSSKIYKIDENRTKDIVLYEINFPNRRSEEKILNHADFLDRRNWMQQHILAKFAIGDNEEEILFYYSYREIEETGYTLGVKLSNGQVFGHRNLKHGYGSKSDPIVKMFFLGPYNLPTYSHVSGYYHVATDIENLTELIYNNKEASLKEINHIDSALFATLMALEDFETPIVMRFKLKNGYE
jgi:hypothetical protein